MKRLSLMLGLEIVAFKYQSKTKNQTFNYHAVGKDFWAQKVYKWFIWKSFLDLLQSKFP